MTAGDVHDRHPRIRSGTAAIICAVLVIPAMIVLAVAGFQGGSHADDPGPLPGYTVSLLFFAVPTALLGTWFFRRANQSERRSFGISLLVLVTIGLALDFAFGPTFFLWPNAASTIGIFVPAIGGFLPVEEIVFFVSGFACLLLLYIWCDSWFLAAYRVEPKPFPRTRGTWVLRAFLLVMIAAVLTFATAYKWRYSAAPGGFPGYLTYVMLVAILPPACCFPAVIRSINWPAFSVTQVTMVLIYLAWEVSLALPNQWWGFRPEMMTGIFISAWSNLPIEEPIVWFASTFTVVVVYESVKIRLQHPAADVRLLLGLRSRSAPLDSHDAPRLQQLE